MSLPETLSLNAWTGTAAAQGTLGPAAAKWGAKGQGIPHSQKPLDFGRPLDLTDWQSPDIGYGVLLPDTDDPAISPAAKAAGVDAPTPVRELLAARPSTVVLRWRPELGARYVRRYFPDRPPQDPVIGLTQFGIGVGRLPRYVLIIGGPDVIPWTVQYAFATNHAVGRLPLESLHNYIPAMLAGWPAADIDPRAAVVWIVDHGQDITSEMRAVIADPLAAKLRDPRLPGFRELVAADATGHRLVTALTTVRPGLLATSSHGVTGPEHNQADLRATLGIPVDNNHVPLGLDALVDAIPGGAVWYANACCSAGSDATSHYTGLLKTGTTAAGVVTAVARLGSTVAPAALRLLSRGNPIRAVFGHVEPTFDWTLRDSETGQGLGHALVRGLSSHLYEGWPLGHILVDYYTGVGVLHSHRERLHRSLATGQTSVRADLVRLRLTALDRQSLVLLGDPTVALTQLV